MHNEPSFITQHGWKVALVLAITVGALIFFGQGSTNAPAAVTEATARPTATASPTPAPLVTHTPGSEALIPTNTPTLPPPTQTPTPVSIYYEVQPGDVPLEIAASFDISVDDLLAANDITDPTKLQIGQALLVPVTATASPTAPTPTPTRTVSPSPTVAPVTYTVKSGDSPLSIAIEFDTSVELIMRANNIFDPRSLQIGQELVIPPAGSEPDTPSTIYQVERGDTISRLAKVYGSTIADIIAANPEIDPDALSIGQTIVIPVTAPPTVSPAAPTIARVTIADLPEGDLAGIQRAMLDNVNIQREAQGLAAYRLDAELTAIAQAHAQDMATRGYFGHVTPEGIDLRARLKSAGLELNWVGENIIRSTRPAGETPAYATTWFMNDRAHRLNLLHKNFNRVGVGVVQESSGWYIIVLVFAEK